MRHVVSISLHLDESVDEFNKYKEILDEWNIKNDLKGRGVEVCQALTPYEFLQKYGVDLSVIKYVKSLGKTNRSFYRCGDLTDISRMLDYIKGCNGVAVFVGDMVIDSRLHKEYMMAIEKDVEIIEIK